MLKLLHHLALLSLVFAFATAAGAKPKPGPNFDDIMESYSLDQLEEVASYFSARVEADPLPKGDKIIKCDPPMTKINTWLAGPMAKLLDERRKLEVEYYVKKPAAFAARIKACVGRCMCAPYQAVLDAAANAPGLFDAAAHQANLKALKSEMRKVSVKQLRKCAEKSDWFCESDLQKYLQHPRPAPKKRS